MTRKWPLLVHKCLGEFLIPLLLYQQIPKNDYSNLSKHKSWKVMETYVASLSLLRSNEKKGSSASTLQISPGMFY